MNVDAYNLGYREIERLGAFLIRCCHDANIYNKLNYFIWHNESGNAYIGYDIKKDAPYISNGLRRYYENDL